MMFHALLCRLVQGNLSKIHGHKCLANGVYPDGVLNSMNETKGFQNAVSCKGRQDSLDPNISCRSQI